MAQRRSDTKGVVPAKNEKENLEALDIVRGYMHEGSEDAARVERLERNKDNYREFRGDKDWSHKSRGQSREHLPKMRMAFEQISALLKKSLVDLGGSWYDIEVKGDPMPGVSGVDLRKLMNSQLLSNDINFPTKISDAVKQAGLESLMIMKVFGTFVQKQQFVAAVVGAEIVNDPLTGLPSGLEPRMELKRKEESVWRLAIELVPTEDYIPDPTGLELYEIHEVTKDLYQVRELSEQGIYDKKVVDQIVANMTDDKDRKRQADEARGKHPAHSTAPKRKRVRLSEVWAVLVDKEGKMIDVKTDEGKVRARNTVTTIADDRFMVRPPSRNPNWSGLRPMAVAPLIRTPHSVWHDALGDYVRSLNNAMDELFNLMLDAGIKGVWGISQIRPEMLLDEDQISEGIPPQETLVLRPGVPENVDVYKRVDTGTNIGESIAVFNMLQSQFSEASMVNQIGLGQLPARQVKACVPMNSQALTRGGWKSPTDLAEGDEILTYNLENEACEWNPVKELYFYNDAEVYEYSVRSFKVQCTDDHKWVQRIRHDHRNVDNHRWSLTPFDETMQVQGREFLHSAKAPDGEGLGRIAIKPWQLLNREDLPQLVVKMTSAERQSFIMGMLAGEGTRHLKKGANDNHLGQITFSQNVGPVLEAFRLACMLEGIATNEYFPHPWKHCACVTLLHVERRGTHRMQKKLIGNMPVWCPSVKNGTWVMRQGTSISITGNTEVVKSSEAQGTLFDGIARDLEDGIIESVLERSFHLIMQHLDEMDVDDIVAAVGTKVAIILLSLTPEERFAIFSNRVKFRVTGLSSGATRAREFQKILGILEIMSSNPAIGQIFAQKYSLSKMVDRLIRSIDIDPESIGVKDNQEAAAQVQLLKSYVAAQETATQTGIEYNEPEGQLGGGGAPGELPTSITEGQNPGEIPPGIEGGGGQNNFQGQSLNQRG